MSRYVPDAHSDGPWFHEYRKENCKYCGSSFEYDEEVKDSNDNSFCCEECLEAWQHQDNPSEDYGDEECYYGSDRYLEDGYEASYVGGDMYGC